MAFKELLDERLSVGNLESTFLLQLFSVGYYSLAVAWDGMWLTTKPFSNTLVTRVAKARLRQL